jgi:hypothetical protein
MNAFICAAVTSVAGSVSCALQGTAHAANISPAKIRRMTTPYEMLARHQPPAPPGYYIRLPEFRY